MTRERIFPEIFLCLVALYIFSIYFTRDMDFVSVKDIIAAKINKGKIEEELSVPRIAIVNNKGMMTITLTEQIVTDKQLIYEVDTALLAHKKREVVLEIGSNTNVKVFKQVQKVLEGEGIKVLPVFAVPTVEQIKQKIGSDLMIGAQE